jgi:hypothetical protein|tara:strand:+ start:52 stop:618 length:567 start_codon:yes stop_codon:yes gene_type:complete
MAKYWVANNPNAEITNTEAVRISNSQREVVRQSDDDDTALTLTVSQSGALILFDEDEAYSITLPAITSSDIGVTYEFMETVVSDLLRKITTAYDNDYYVGGVTNLFDAAKTDGSTGGIAFLSAGATDTIITLGDDNLANAGGGLGARVVLTAVLTGNTASGGGAKLVWAVSGNKVAQAEDDTGAAFFS